MKRFESKFVIITGAAQGIGQATAVRIAEEGGDCALIDINVKGLQGTKHLVESKGVRAFTYECDVRDHAGTKSVIDQAAADLGGVHCLAHIAGVLRTQRTEEVTPEQWQYVIDVNLTGTFNVNQAALVHLLKNRFSALVNMASTSAIGKHPWMAAYAASKGGVISLTRSLYIEYVKQGLRANCVVGGGIATSLHTDFRAPAGADMELLRGAMPYGGFAKPSHAASVIAFLLSDDARFVNGTEVRADGGALS